MMALRDPFDRTVTLGSIVVLAFLVSACAYRGTIDQPATIKFTWYSYLAGDDIRQTCVPNGLPRYRLIYNGRYEEQLRSYDMVGLDNGGARLVSRVLGRMQALALIRDPLDLQDPWRWKRHESRHSARDFAAFKAVLDESGLRRSMGGTMELLSTEFYWIVSGCEKGEFLFNAWRYGSDRYATLRFPEMLLGYDGTEIALNPPRLPSPLDRMGTQRTGGQRSSDSPYVFRIKVGDDGVLLRGPAL